MEKADYKNLNLKNGWDLPKDMAIPLTGFRMKRRRERELLLKEEVKEYVVPENDTKRGTDAGEADFVKKAKEDTQAGKLGNTKLKRRTIGAIILAAVVIVVLRLSFGPPILLADISSYENVEITIEGLTDEAFTITPKELSKMKLDKTTVEIHSEEADTESAIGPTLDTFLASYGRSVDEFRSMKVYTAKDVSNAYVKTLEEETLILSIANGNEALEEKIAPLQIAIKDGSADEWTGYVVKIVFTEK
ncbi:hypothetical protein [Eubacterium oxidoreducens]|uniref:Oxidoreductase molybdopterin binding domain-containing protein n=1 Tax=Eubacterium oxidoreducens TaxID=1732 RepID=A0A1G6BGM4_EUBOX|nr:hypothetical protein [Eubacterium oxidoreducens]SDB19734.1 hypothetical protein SAMN02910417_01486 [Eubacterium oxidoreducens]